MQTPRDKRRRQVDLATHEIQSIYWKEPKVVSHHLPNEHLCTTQQRLGIAAKDGGQCALLTDGSMAQRRATTIICAPDVEGGGLRGTAPHTGQEWIEAMVVPK